MRHFLDFEKPIAELETKLDELRALPAADGTISEDIAKISAKVDALLEATYESLTPWQKTQVARHPERPKFKDYVAALVEDWQPLLGDRSFADDPAIQGGLGRIGGFSVVLIGHEKGGDTESRLKHNFGMARPEGYRKAQRLMRLAERFGLAVVTLIDTAGAYPGVDAEARGQAEAIAKSIDVGLDLRAPLVSVVIGEGGSGGAIAIGTGDRVLMLEHAIYSVISPEGCASILWRTAAEARTAADALR
ncbi:MAG: acetyl-CoA carboxylase carboxyltransferase subunit alpha, partial [Pseudomonadota bacterium]